MAGEPGRPAQRAAIPAAPAGQGGCGPCGAPRRPPESLRRSSDAVPARFGDPRARSRGARASRDGARRTARATSAKLPSGRGGERLAQRSSIVASQTVSPTREPDVPAAYVVPPQKEGLHGIAEAWARPRPRRPPRGVRGWKLGGESRCPSRSKDGAPRAAGYPRRSWRTRRRRGSARRAGRGTASREDNPGPRLPPDRVTKMRRIKSPPHGRWHRLSPVDSDRMYTVHYIMETNHYIADEVLRRIRISHVDVSTVGSLPVRPLLTP